MSYKAVLKSPGIFQHEKSKRYQARKSIKGKQYKETFDTVYDARLWLSTFDGNCSAVVKKEDEKNFSTSTFEEVWNEMQRTHFPLLARTTREVWHRRFELLKLFLPYHMEEITSSLITTWVEKNTAYFKSDAYENECRGDARRCNLDNELNLFVTIFNWYKQSARFEKEAVMLPNPVKTSHKRLGFIRPVPIKDRSITLEAALLFFQCCRDPYKDLALFQYFSASRISEAAGLQWSRVDFENKRITIMETSSWDSSTKLFVDLNPFPKNRTPRFVYMTAEIEQLLKRRKMQAIEGNNFVFHIEGKPLHYCNIQINYRHAQRTAQIPFRGTHILRHGMAKLARKVGGGLDAVIAMTGHKDFKLADHYSKLDSDYQKEISMKIMDHIRDHQHSSAENIISIANYAKAK